MPDSAPNTCYQINIQLDHVNPPVWRDIIVPSNISLAWLHELIQEAMGWIDLYLHQFTHKGTHYIDRECEILEDGIDEASVSLDQLLKKVDDQLSYNYNLETGWKHTVSLKKILSTAVPICCLRGVGACPPENCRGPLEYMQLCDLRKANRAGVRLAKQDQERLKSFELETNEDFGPEDVDDVNETFADILDEVTDRGGLGVGGASLYDELSKPDELDDENQFETLLGELTEGLESLTETEFPMLEQILLEEEEPEEFAEPYEELNLADCTAFHKAMEEATELRKREPWKTLNDCDIFGIEDPETGSINVVSVLGAGKEVFSLHVHRGPYALPFWRKALKDPGEISMDVMLYRSSIIEVDFCNKADMEDPDLALYERINFETPPRGRKRWIRFRTYRPRTYPWFPQAEELTQLKLGMRLCHRYLDLMANAKNPESFRIEPNTNLDLPTSLKIFRLAEGAQPTETTKWTLSDVGIDWASCETPIAPYQPSEFELHQLAELPRERDVWELGAIFLPAPVLTEAGPIIPILAIALDAEMLEPPTPNLDTDLNLSPTQVLWNCLKLRALDEGVLPNEILVSTDSAESTLSSFAELTGIKVRYVENLPLLENLFQTMIQEM
jgi:hypothetical protein